MRFRERNSSSHPAPETLALHARGDLALIPRLRLRAHLLECDTCGRQMALFAQSLAELKREAASETLTAFEAVADWSSLEREMLGNIVVGVAAARCIENVGRKRTWIPRLAVAGGLTALFVGGWVSHIPREETAHLTSSLSRLAGISHVTRLGDVVQTTPTGIAVRSEGVTLTILHPPSAVVAVSGSSSVEARYVDEDTGQLTITNVYGQ